MGTGPHGCRDDSLCGFLIAASGAHSVREGGTLRVAVLYGSFEGIDPALANPGTPLLAPTCGALTARMT
jgi:hypothetical protein